MDDDIGHVHITVTDEGHVPRNSTAQANQLDTSRNCHCDRNRLLRFYHEHTRVIEEFLSFLQRRE